LYLSTVHCKKNQEASINGNNVVVEYDIALTNTEATLDDKDSVRKHTGYGLHTVANLKGTFS
jgi:hypothetical protein